MLANEVLGGHPGNGSRARRSPVFQSFDGDLENIEALTGS
jgi:hypothetical protein